MLRLINSSGGSVAFQTIFRPMTSNSIQIDSSELGATLWHLS